MCGEEATSGLSMSTVFVAAIVLQATFIVIPRYSMDQPYLIYHSHFVPNTLCS
jgi:hypothetical protein